MINDKDEPEFIRLVIGMNPKGEETCPLAAAARERALA